MNYCFSEYKLVPKENRLYFSDKVISDDIKFVLALRLLAEAHPHPVSKNLLIEELWKGQIVTESSLSHLIADIRRVLNGNQKNQEIIQTVHGQGYRLKPLVKTHEYTPPQATQEFSEKVGKKFASISQNTELRRRILYSLVAMACIAASYPGVRYFLEDTDFPYTRLTVLPIDIDSELTGDDWIKYGIMDHVAKQLDQHEKIYSHSSTQVIRATSHLSLDDRKNYDQENLFSDVCNVMGCTHVLDIRYICKNGQCEYSYIVHSEEARYAFSHPVTDSPISSANYILQEVSNILLNKQDRSQLLVNIGGQQDSLSQRDLLIGIHDLYSGQIKSAQKYFEIAGEKSEENYWATLYLAYTHLVLGDFDQAKYYIETLKQEPLDASQFALLSRLTSIIYAQTGDIPKAIDENLKNIEHWKKEGNRIQVASEQVNLGASYSRAGLPALAQEALADAIQVFKALGIKSLEAPAQLNLSESLLKLERYREAYEASKRASLLARETRSRRVEAKAIFNKIESQIELGFLQNLEDELASVKTMFESFGDNDSLKYIELAEIRIMEKRGKLSEAIEKMEIELAKLSHSENKVIQYYFYIEAALLYLKAGDLTLAEYHSNKLSPDLLDIRAKYSFVQVQVALKLGQTAKARELASKVKERLGVNWGEQHQEIFKAIVQANQKNQVAKLDSD